MRTLLGAIEAVRNGRGVMCISYGIGPLFESPVSQYQYAVLLAVKEHLGCPALAFDPILGEAEVATMGDAGIQQIAFPYVRPTPALGT